jgi:hypothetical protein
MRTLLFAATAAMCLVLGASAPSWAVTFSGTVDPSSDVESCSGPVVGGVGICFTQIQPFNFDLINSGDKTFADLFTVTIYDEIDNRDDLQTADIWVDFDFTDPGAVNGTVYGGVTGEITRVSGPDLRSLLIEWDDPITLDFGAGIVLVAELLPLEIMCGTECISVEWVWEEIEYYDSNGHRHKKKKKKKKWVKTPVYDRESGVVQGFFTLESAPGSTPEIPLPTTLPLLMSGLMGFAYLGYRRRRAA